MPDSPSTYFWLCLSAFAAGVVNSVAGGGTLLTFPALMSLGGLPGVMANGTSTVALVPGSMTAAWGYRKEFALVRQWALLLAVPSLIGGVIGTGLVIAFPDQFDRLIPWLILTAAILFLVQPTLSRLTGVGHKHALPSAKTQVFVVGFQLLVAVYGGYFGAGIGILMISSLSLMGTGDIHRTNALKTFLAACINAMSAIFWIIYKEVRWDYALSMMAAAIVGGYLGARVARRLPKGLVRWGVIAIGFGLAGYYFYRQLA
jgi:uncharacterized protein